MGAETTRNVNTGSHPHTPSSTQPVYVTYKYISMCVGWPSEKEDRPPVSLTAALKGGFQQVSFVYMGSLVKFSLQHTYSCRSSSRVTRFKRGQGSCSFHCCIEKRISAGVICIYGEPGEIPLFITAVKAAGALPSFVSGHSRAGLLQLSLLWWRGEFHQVLHIYKWDLLIFPLHHNSESMP